MAETCERCHLAHKPAEFPDGANAHAVDALTFMACMAAQMTAMRSLLQRIGKQVACGGCGASMYFVVHNNGKRVPYTEAGLNHFIDCEARDQFKRPKP